MSVDLGQRDETHEVTVRVTGADGSTDCRKAYRLSAANEADEDAPFPGSTEPETIAVTVDGTRFERDWPGFEQPELPCDGPNRAGVEIWFEDGQDGSTTLRIEPGCQHVTTEREPSPKPRSPGRTEGPAPPPVRG